MRSPDQKTEKAPKLEVHGHRGSRSTHPENTFAAFEEAFSSGANAFELDTQLTSDGEVIVFHDFELSARVCRKNGQPPLGPMEILRTMWSEVNQWDVGSVVQAKYLRQKLSVQKIPTLDSALKWVKGKPAPFYVNVEVKAAPEWPDALVDTYTAKVIRLIQNYGLENRCLLMSFDFRVIRAAKKNMPALRSSCLFENAADFVMVAKQNGATQIGPHFSLLTEALVKETQSAGLRVMPWTVNAPEDWARLKRWGVDGIITDSPRELIQFLT